MNVADYSLRNVKIDDRMSEETTCFSADLCLDGRRVASVCNRGNGGPHEFSFKNLAALHAFERWAATQPHEFDFEIQGQAIDAMLARFESEKVIAKLRRECAKITLFVARHDPQGSFRSVKSPVDDKVRKYIADKYPGALIVNDIDDAALRAALGVA